MAKPLILTAEPRLTHADLVRVAHRWLLGSRKCTVAFAELTTALSLIPDAVGWLPACRGSRSVVIECKTSIADFRRDAKKSHVSGPRVFGWERWYLAPDGVLPIDEVMDATRDRGCGLLVVRRARVHKVIPAQPLWDTRPRDEAAERCLLISALRRHALGVAFDATIGRFETVEAQEARRG